ncbi:MAG: elongation factor P [Candidatus Gracilibacteria bacterium]|nr:elongation factor P [Candidatus Gracilibacteria bacterium]
MDISQVKKGNAIVYNGQKWFVSNISFVNPGKGTAFYPTKLKNLNTGNVVEFNIKSGESIEPADLFNYKCQYLYSDGTDYFFMNSSDFSQFSISGDTLGNDAQYLQEEKEYEIMFIDGNPASVQLPPKIVLEVTEASDAVKGDTANNATKDVKLENGMSIRVPMFIKQGDKVRISTEDGSYYERVS